MIEIRELLAKVGLTKQESTVYLALLELQEAQTGQLCRKTKIASSNIYNILNSLAEKGLVSYRLHNNIKVFMPSPPESLNELFLEKQRRLDEEREQVQELISNLKKREVKEEPLSNYKYYEGIIGIKSMWHELHSKLTSRTELRIYGTKREAYERLVGFYDELHKIRTKKRSKVMIIIPPTHRELGARRADKFTQVRYSNLLNEAEWGVIGDMFYLQHIVTKHPHGFLIKDEIFADTFKKAFDKLWEQSKE